MKVRFHYSILFSLLVGSLYAQSTTLSGYILDASTDAPLPYAAVANSQSAEYANELGYFQISLSGKLSDTLSFSMVGYSSVQLVWPTDSLQMRPVRLRPSLDLPTVVVRAPSAIAPGGGILAIDLLAQNRIPTLGGERDYIKGLALLPGISAGVEGTANLNIRGGEPEQTHLLIDGSPVYNANHLGGFLSAIPPGAVKQMTVYKGGMPARFGGRLSGLIDVQLKDGIPPKKTGELSIGTATLGLSLHRAVGQNKALLVSGRFAYPSLAIDIIKSSGFKKGVSGDKTNFYIHDLVLKLVSRPSSRLSTSATYYQSADNGFVQEAYGADARQENFDRTNHLFSIRMNYDLGRSLAFKSNAYFSRFLYQFEGKDNLVYSADSIVQVNSAITRSKIVDLGWRGSLSLHASNTWDFELGMDLVWHHFSASNTTTLPYSQQSVGRFTSNDAALEYAFYGSFEAELIKNRLFANGGLRFSSLLPSNTISLFAEPRLRMEYKITDKLSANASVERHRQYLHRLQGSGSLLPNEVWVLANDNAPPSHAWQAAVGLSHRTEKSEWYVEAFSKEMDNLIRLQFEAGDIYEVNQEWTNVIFRDGKGTAKGVECYLAQHYGKWETSISYTLLYADRQFQDVNDGQTFPYRFDRRHDANASLSFIPNDKWEFTALFVYQTGTAETVPTATANGLLFYSGINNFRMPSYQRLDLGVAKFWRKNENRKFDKTLRLSIYNTLNRLNAHELLVRPVTRIVKDPETDVERTETSYQLFQVGFFPLLLGVNYSMAF